MPSTAVTGTLVGHTTLVVEKPGITPEFLVVNSTRSAFGYRFVTEVVAYVCSSRVFACPAAVTLAITAVLETFVYQRERGAALIQVSVHVTVVASRGGVRQARVHRAIPGTVPTSIAVTHTVVLDTSVDVFKLGISFEPFAKGFAIITACSGIQVTRVYSSLARAVPTTITVTRAVVVNATVYVLEMGIPLVFYAKYVAVVTTGSDVKRAYIDGVLIWTVPGAITVTQTVELVAAFDELELFATLSHLSSRPAGSALRIGRLTEGLHPLLWAVMVAVTVALTVVLAAVLLVRERLVGLPQLPVSVALLTLRVVRVCCRNKNGNKCQGQTHPINHNDGPMCSGSY